MYVKKYDETPKFELFGNKYKMLLPRDITSVSESAMVSIAKGKGTPVHKHPAEEQIYYVLQGKGKIKVGGDEKIIEKDSIVYIPLNTDHEITCISEENLEYIYVAVWPKGIPAGEKSWEKAYLKK